MFADNCMRMLNCSQICVKITFKWVFSKCITEKNLSLRFLRHEPTVVQIGRRHNARTKERRHRRLCAVEITLSHLK